MDVEGTTEWNSSASTDNLKRMGRAEATTNEEGGDFKMAGASLLDLKATPIVACWSNHRKGVGFAFHTPTETTLTPILSISRCIRCIHKKFYSTAQLINN